MLRNRPKGKSEVYIPCSKLEILRKIVHGCFQSSLIKPSSVSTTSLSRLFWENMVRSTHSVSGEPYCNLYSILWVFQCDYAKVTIFRRNNFFEITFDHHAKSGIKIHAAVCSLRRSIHAKRQTQVH